MHLYTYTGKEGWASSSNGCPVQGWRISIVTDKTYSGTVCMCTCSTYNMHMCILLTFPIAHRAGRCGGNGRAVHSEGHSGPVVYSPKVVGKGPDKMLEHAERAAWYCTRLDNRSRQLKRRDWIHSVFHTRS